MGLRSIYFTHYLEANQLHNFFQQTCLYTYKYNPYARRNRNIYCLLAQSLIPLFKFFNAILYLAQGLLWPFQPTNFHATFLEKVLIIMSRFILHTLQSVYEFGHRRFYISPCTYVRITRLVFLILRLLKSLAFVSTKG